MTETFIDASHLRDPHHPNTGFMMQVVDIYLNLHNSFGFPMPPKMHEIGDLERYDRDWEDNGRKYQDFHWEEYEVDKQRFLSTLIRKIICCNCHYFNESFFKFSCNVSLPHKKCLLSQASQKFRLYQITRRELILLRHISTLQPLPKTGMTADWTSQPKAMQIVDYYYKTAQLPMKILKDIFNKFIAPRSIMSYNILLPVCRWFEKYKLEQARRQRYAGSSTTSERKPVLQRGYHMLLNMRGWTHSNERI